jgi:hypothetical protein
MRTSENSVKAKFTGIAHLPHRPGPEGQLYGESQHIRWLLSESYVHQATHRFCRKVGEEHGPRARTPS